MPLEIAQALSASRLAEIRAQLSPLLPTTRPTTLEIGSGHGHFLTAYAEAHLDHLCIGIDLIGDRLERSARKSNRAKLTNVVWMHAEATLFLEALPADTALAEIFVLFSDPWPKRRHWKNRVVQPEFLSLLASRAGQGARLYFRTDHSQYFEQVGALINQHPAWTLVADAPWPFELPTVFQKRAESHQSLVATKG